MTQENEIMKEQLIDLLASGELTPEALETLRAEYGDEVDQVLRKIHQGIGMFSMLLGRPLVEPDPGPDAKELRGENP